MYKTMFISDEEITEAQRIRAEEDKLAGNQVYSKQWSWIGKLGEWTFQEFYPHYPAKTVDLQAEDFDFSHFLTGECIDVKTRHAKTEFRYYHQMMIDKKQFDSKPYDIIVWAHYCESEPRHVALVGWSTRERLLKLAEILNKGYVIRDNSGKELFTLDRDNYRWGFRAFLDMDLLSRRTNLNSMTDMI